MRVYIERGTPAMFDLLNAAERASRAICEECSAEAWTRKNSRGLWRAQRRDAIKFKSEIVKAAGGVFDAAVVQALLELPSVEAVHKAVRHRKLLTVEHGDRLWFPSCQFAGGQVLSGIQTILKAIPETNGWRVLQYLLGREDGLAGDRPIDLVRGTNEDIDRAVRFARVLES